MRKYQDMFPYSQAIGPSDLPDRGCVYDDIWVFFDNHQRLCRAIAMEE
ncbi:MAG: hypothetical protein AB4352_28740 [Hormoscilla sp.]